MMKLKRFGIAVFALALLAACGAAAPQAAASAEPSAPTMQPQETAAAAGEQEEDAQGAQAALQNKPAAQQELETLLDAMEREVTIGTAGSHMNTVRIAAGLMNWGVGTELTAEEVRQVTLAWLIDKGDDEGAAIHEKFAAVDEVCQSLLGERGEEVLAAADVEDAACPWGDEPPETVEAIMNAVGLR